MHQAAETWNEIKAILARKDCLTEMGLQPGASEKALIDLEHHLGVALPELLKAMLRIHDGQTAFGVLFGMQMLSTQGIRSTWDGWRSIEEDELNKEFAWNMASRPPGAVKPMYTNPHWIALSRDAGGNHMGLDFDPDHSGSVGQMIVFGRDEDTKILLAPDISPFLLHAIEWLKQADWDGECLTNRADGGFALPAIFQ